VELIQTVNFFKRVVPVVPNKLQESQVKHTRLYSKQKHWQALEWFWQD